MKFRFFVILCTLFLISVGSCQLIEPEVDEGNGSVSFVLDKPINTFPTDENSSSIHEYIILTIRDKVGTVVIDRGIYPLADFSGRLTTSTLPLREGVYYVTEFLVSNDSGKVIRAAPIKGSPLSEFVNEPLPMRFEVLTDKVSEIIPKVLPVDGQAPEAFGYAGFSFVINDYTYFSIAVFSNLAPDNRFALVDANILFLSDTDTLFTGQTGAKTLKIAVRSDIDSIRTVVSSPGFVEYDSTMSISRLKELAGTPLVVILDKTNNNNLLVFYLPFDNNIKDESSFHQTIRILGHPQLGEGKFGQGLHFMGENDGLVVSNDPSLNPASITVSAWVKVPASFFGIGNNALVSKGAPTHENPFYQYHMGLSGDQYLPYRGFSSGSFCVGNHYYHPLSSPSSIWQVGDWNLFTGVYESESKTISFYLNGNLIASEATEISLTDLGQDVFIARFDNLPVSTPVWMDEIRIYNKALTQPEIASLMNP